MWFSTGALDPLTPLWILQRCGKSISSGSRSLLLNDRNLSLNCTGILLLISWSVNLVNLAPKCSISYIYFFHSCKLNKNQIKKKVTGVCTAMKGSHFLAVWCHTDNPNWICFHKVTSFLLIFYLCLLFSTPGWANSIPMTLLSICLSTGDKISACNYEWNLERMSNSSQSTHPLRTSALGRITQRSHITYYSLMFFIAYTFKKDNCMCLQHEWKL